VTAKTPAERQAARRAREADKNHAEVRGIFAHTDDHPPIKAAAQKIIKRRKAAKESGK